jgi:hypothetical protein
MLCNLGLNSAGNFTGWPNYGTAKNSKKKAREG